MDFKLTIHTDNDVFQPDPARETARILREVATGLEAGGDFSKYQTLFDLNGNDVGRAGFKPQE